MHHELVRERSSRPLRRPRPTSCAALLALALALALAASGCESREDRVRDTLAAFEAEALRLSWSCDAMAQGLEQWIDLYEDELREDVHVLADEIAALSDAEEQREALDALAPPPNPDARSALAACSEHSGVQRALARVADSLEPLARLDEPPSPPAEAGDEPQ